MNKVISTISVLILLVFLASCTKTIRPAPNQNVEYEQGVAVIKSHKENGVVVRLLSNEFNSDNPPAFYVAVANYSEKPFILSTKNVIASVNERFIKVYTYKELKRKIEIERAWTSFAIGMNAASQSIMASQPSYSYTSGYSTYSGSLYYGSTTIFDPAKTAQAQAAINANMTQQLAQVASNANIQLNNLNVVLRENTVKPGDYRGGVVLIDPAFISSGSKLTIKVKTPSDMHPFYFEVPSTSRTRTKNTSKYALTLDKTKTPKNALIIKQKKSLKEHSISLSDRWEKAGVTLSGLSLFIDKLTIAYQADNLVRVWVRTVNDSVDYMDLVEIDCSALRIRTLESQKKGSVFSKISNEWKYIAPESPSEIVSFTSCKQDNDKK